MAEADAGADKGAEGLVAAAAAEAATAAATAKPAEKPAGGLGFIYDDKGAETVFGKAGEDGRPANVPEKYWDKDKKAVKADVVFNQLRWAEGKLGAKLEVIGAPADGKYEIVVPDGIDYELPEDDPMVQGFLDVAKKHDVSQAFVNEVLASVIGRVAETGIEGGKAELAKLGEGAAARVNDITKYLQANLEPANAQAIIQSMASAEAFVAIESLIKKAMPPKFSPKVEGEGGKGAAGRMTREQWNEMNFRTNAQGQRLRSIDPEYNKLVEDAALEVFGGGRRDASGRAVDANGVPA